MQVNLSVDCTPAEARAFFGLPDVTPLHAIWIEKMKAISVEGVKSEDLERMFKMWSAGMTESFDQWQRMFWQAAGSGMGLPIKR